MLSKKSKGPNIPKTSFCQVVKSVKPLVQISSWVCSPILHTLVLSNTQIVVKSYQFSPRFESENHARPWFCLTLKQLLKVISFHIGLSLRTMPWFCLTLRYLSRVISFPIGLSSRTQAWLRIFLMLSKKSKGPNMPKPSFCWVVKSVKPLVQISSWVCSLILHTLALSNTQIIVKSYQFSPRFESEDHA